jgi:hypothetical protein
VAPGSKATQTVRRTLVVLALLGIVASLVSWRMAPAPTSRRLSRPLIVDSPFANTRPEVGYVGDEACARCHAVIAESFRRHPMGRSLAPIDAATADPQGGSNGPVLFAAGRFEYSIERRGNHVYHVETGRDATGRAVDRNDAEVRFMLGSGYHGASYLINRDGFLFESPMTWYSRERRWDLSPGYQGNNLHFDRQVLPLCVYCHANRVEPVEGTTNRYQAPIFRGYAIGSERCHGPGELHVKDPGRDLAIVNPADLEPSLRDAVCEQCHLQGKQRILKYGRRDDDFRPGIPFDRVWSVFEHYTGPAVDRFVGEVEQMQESRCFAASDGRLGCISCHDPHRDPPADERVSFYRDRCQAATPSGVAACRSRSRKSAAAPGIASVAICHVCGASTSRMPRQPIIAFLAGRAPAG